MNFLFFNHVRAEILKLKSTPVIYLVGFCCIFVTSIVLLAHSLDINNTAILNANPWKRCFGAGLGIYSFFVTGPFVILLVTAVVFVEQKANAWKYLYTMPVQRGNIYFAKLMVLIGIIFLCAFCLVLCLIASGYILDYIYPELEFGFYRPPFLENCKNILHTILALLGVLGLQYFLSLWFRNFLIPLSIGMVGYILGFILTTTNTKITLYVPFTYAMIVKDYGMFSSDKVLPIWGGWLTNVELYSILYFLFFVALGYFYERFRAVK